jgi:ADP-heptose:LPS heptosyltransferase
MSQLQQSLAKLDNYMKNQQYNDVIQLSSTLYTTVSPDSKCLEYILEAYRKTTNPENSGINTREMAIKQFKKLLCYTPPQVPCECILHNELGVYYVNSNEHKLAIHHFKQVLSIRNDIPDVYNNIAVCHVILKEYDKARVCLNLSLRLSQNDSVYLRLGELYLYTKKYSESIKAYECMKNPSTTDLYNKCFPYLANKQFLKGFQLYENRLAFNNISPQTKQISRVEIPSIPYWNGKDKCNHLMIIYEQGIGDNIQYFRFIIELSNKYPNLKITYFCRTNVSHLFNVDQYDNIIIRDDSQPLDISIYDKKIYTMSLPYILKLEKITLNTINYIAEDEKNNELWKQNLSVFTNKLKVGFVYSGLLISYIDKQINLDDFKDICIDDRIQTICLHRMDEKISEDFSRIDFADKIMNYDIDNLKPFHDTISLLRNIDVLVTIDTSIAHMAGVMGVKTLLLIGYTSEWRWFNNNDKVWYDSVEIIRMNEQKPLADLLPRVKKLLITEYESKYPVA